MFHCSYNVPVVSHLFFTPCMRCRKAQIEVCLAFERRNSEYLFENSMSPSCLLRSRPEDISCLKHNHVNIHITVAFCDATSQFYVHQFLDINTFFVFQNKIGHKALYFYVFCTIFSKIKTNKCTDPDHWIAYYKTFYLCFLDNVQRLLGAATWWTKTLKLACTALMENRCQRVMSVNQKRQILTKKLKEWNSQIIAPKSGVTAELGHIANIHSVYMKSNTMGSLSLPKVTKVYLFIFWYKCTWF